MPIHQVDAALKGSNANAGDYDTLVLPGGLITPDILCAGQTAGAQKRDFDTHDKMVVLICQTPWLSIEAGVVEGREMTAYHSIRTDMKMQARRLSTRPWRSQTKLSNRAV